MKPKDFKIFHTLLINLFEKIYTYIFFFMNNLSVITIFRNFNHFLSLEEILISSV